MRIYLKGSDSLTSYCMSNEIEIKYGTLYECEKIKPTGWTNIKVPAAGNTEHTVEVNSDEYIYWRKT